MTTRLAMVGLGKMGLSHYAIANSLPGAEVVAACDSNSYVLGILNKNNGVATFSDMQKMLRGAAPDAVIIATPSHLHESMVQIAIEAGVAIFCEKPFALDPARSQSLASAAETKGLVTQVGYHYRYVATFVEMMRLVQTGVIGEIKHGLAEAYGPVVLRPRGSTWRSNKSQGGGALLDYAAHPVNLLNWMFGAPSYVDGQTLTSIFSRDIEDAVQATLHWGVGKTTVQLAVSWSDDSERKMSTKISLWGTNGKIVADRQELQVYLREPSNQAPEYGHGWSLKYTTDLSKPVDFYVRGEEYSAQLADFINRVNTGTRSGVNDFASAAVTDSTLYGISSGYSTNPR